MTPDPAAELGPGVRVILVVAGHPPEQIVTGWWPQTPGDVATLRELVSMQDR